MDKLNKTQERIYAYLLERAQASVVPPTVREIGTAVGLKSTSSVQGNLDALEKVTEALSQNVIAVDGLGTHAMSFRVERDASGYAFLSIPVSEGWRIRVNGKTVEPLALGDCLTVLPLEAGSNEISMDYHIEAETKHRIRIRIGIRKLTQEHFFHFIN